MIPRAGSRPGNGTRWTIPCSGNSIPGRGPPTWPGSPIQMETPQGSEPRLHWPGKRFLATPLGYPARLLAPLETYQTVSDQIGDIPLRNPRPILWRLGFMAAGSLFLLFCVAVGYLLYRGVGIWGINIPVAWA